MKRRHSEKGMALVITLMMLAIVTFMSVVFLSLSRRERANVTIVEEQANARRMSDAALDRAKADLVANMNNKVEEFLGTATNAPAYGPAVDQQHVAIANGAVQRALFAYDLRVSRNFSNPNGFSRKAGDKNNPWNVGYYDSAGNAYDEKGNRLLLGTDDYYQHVANQQYDPRPPVIVTDRGTNDNRFYIDLNRNGMFDPNGVYEVTGVNNERYNATSLVEGKGPNWFNAYFSGDPEWIGVLERPDLPHSETNRFIGRYAYIMMPTGKSLDINFIHNLAVYDQPNIKYDGVDHARYRFSRNQGVGSWELNMAGFLVDLHTNVWRPLPTFYTLTTNMASGFAFRDAVGLLQYRFNNSHTNLFQPRDIFGTTNRWALDYVDMAGDGPVVPYNLYYNSTRPNFDGISGDNDNDTRFWHGGEHMQFTSEYPDVQRYFRVNTPGASTEMFDFYKNFTNAVSSSRTNTYDRYAYYRMLGQMGADSKPALQNKIHLNFANEPGTISTNLTPWVTNSTFANAMVPTMLVRSNTSALIRQADNGERYEQRSNNLTNFFLIAADRMLRESMVTNVYLDEFGKWRTNYTIGCTYFHDPSLNTVTNTTRFIVGSPVRPDFSITNIQVYHEPIAPAQWRPNQLSYTNAEYTAAVHRVLQLAANIYDSMYNDAGRSTRKPNDPYFPTVWRPLYSISPTNITITGWEPQVNSALAITHAMNTNLFRSPADYFTNRTVVITNVSFYGQPWVVGVKKGWPTFNEFSMETHAQLTRKLEVFKEPALKGKEISLTNYQQLAAHTRQIYLLGLSNTVGLEAWNSYALTNNRRIRIDARVETRVGIERVTRRDSNRVVTASQPVFASPRTFITSTNGYIVSDWPGRKGNIAIKDAIPKGMPRDGESDFRIPVYSLLPVLPDSQYSEVPGPYGTFFANPAVFQSITNTPDFVISITNRMQYLATDDDEKRIIDFVTLDNVITKVDLDEAIRGSQNFGNAVGGAGFDPATLWSTDPAVKGQNTFGVSFGVMNQLQASLDILQLGADQWKDYSATARIVDQIEKFQQFMYGTNSGPMSTNLVSQAPFSPSRHLYLISRYQANDPLVHYMESDLRDPRQTTRPIILKLTDRGQNDELGLRNNKRQAIRTDKLHGVEFQDPRIFESDDWQFPIAKLDDPTAPTPRAYGIPNFNYRFPNIGALGQIHRGTPWQTVYLKAMPVANTDPRALGTNQAPWIYWAGSYGTAPTNDWRLVGVFTTAPTESAARGLLSVNQSGTAAWSAVLSGVPVITNSWSDQRARGNPPPRFGIPNSPTDAVGVRDLLIEPGSAQLSNIVRNINAYRATRPMGLFSYMGEVLGTPMLSFGAYPVPNFPNYKPWSPYLRVTDAQYKNVGDGNPDWHAFTDEALEAIPQRILGLLKEDEPRVTIYCFGQTLKPAPRSYVTSADFYNLCVNYQVTGEYVTKAVVRVEGEFKNPVNPLRTIVESFEVLAPFE